MAVDTLGHLLALNVTSADEQDRARVGAFARAVQKVMEKSLEVAYVDQGYTAERPSEAAEKHRIRLKVVKLPEAKRGFVLLPKSWVVERTFGWLTHPPRPRSASAFHSLITRCRFFNTFGRKSGDYRVSVSLVCRD